MNEQERRNYAADIIAINAEGIDYITVAEAYADEFGEDADLDGEETRAIHDLIISARLDISWKEDGDD